MVNGFCHIKLRLTSEIFEAKTLGFVLILISIHFRRSRVLMNYLRLFILKPVQYIVLCHCKTSRNIKKE